MKPDLIKLKFKRFSRSEDYPDMFISRIHLYGKKYIILMPRKWTSMILPSRYYDVSCRLATEGRALVVESYSLSNLEVQCVVEPTGVLVTKCGKEFDGLYYSYPSSYTPKDFFEKKREEFLRTFKNIGALLEWRGALVKLCASNNLAWEHTRAYVYPVAERRLFVGGKEEIL